MWPQPVTQYPRPNLDYQLPPGGAVLNILTFPRSTGGADRVGVGGGCYLGPARPRGPERPCRGQAGRPCLSRGHPSSQPASGRPAGHGPSRCGLARRGSQAEREGASAPTGG